MTTQIESEQKKSSSDFHILVVEDDSAMRELLVESLNDEGYLTSNASNGREGVAVVRDQHVDLVITDLRMPDLDGLDMVRELRTLDSHPDVITITAFGTIDTAIKAMKLGAFDYITKPFEIDQLLISVERALRDRNLRCEVTRLRQEVASRYGFGNIIGHSEAMQEVFELIRRLKDSPVSVLITGESGTGKEMVAKALHFNGARADKAFIAVNCAAIPDNLLESELFGYKKGAFTDAKSDRKGLFKQADGGTLFLDEIGELPVQLQAKMLRVLQEREVTPLGSSEPIPIDVRVISATNSSLTEMLEEGSFRSDLYYRLNVVQIDIPPLRARQQDILPLATHLLEKAAKAANKAIPRITSEAAKLLIGSSWPGNVRQLENVIERAVALSQRDEIRSEDLPLSLKDEPNLEWIRFASEQEMTVSELEKSYILHVLDQEKGNKSRAATKLGLDRKTLYRKLEDYKKSD